uniref:Uncharacterized protein n=1 Tax=Arundo donax TaxID=35708 RepID=A0A0A9DN32_ARUDO
MDEFIFMNHLFEVFLGTNTTLHLRKSSKINEENGCDLVVCLQSVVSLSHC